MIQILLDQFRDANEHSPDTPSVPPLTTPACTGSSRNDQGLPIPVDDVEEVIAVILSRNGTFQGSFRKQFDSGQRITTVSRKRMKILNQQIFLSIVTALLRKILLHRKSEESGWENHVPRFSELRLFRHGPLVSIICHTDSPYSAQTLSARSLPE
jgi:hypothetical protein